MARKIAIDWDETELRLVAANCSGSTVKVTEAALIEIENGDVMETLRHAISERGLERAETLVAIGRGKAELRELQLPPVPADELPDMVRFQAIRSFASAGDSATVDYLVTGQNSAGTSMIAAAVGPAKLSEIHEVCEVSDLQVKRIALRPLAASALFLSDRKQRSTSGETVLIDLLSDDAEIVVARNGKVVFVRTVRLPSSSAGRPAALAGELRRSLVACGADASPDRVILWGLESIHQEDVAKIAEASGSPVDVVNPFDLVDVDRKAKDTLPQHVGRLAPLVGLLANDETGGERLIDFLNPRKRAEEKPETLKKALMIGVPIAAVLLLAFLAQRQLSDLDRKIEILQQANRDMEEPVQIAAVSRDRTERVDAFLDGDVNWLHELRRLAESMPPAEKMIVKSVKAAAETRGGGGTIQITGAVTDPSVIEEFEEALRDEEHRVFGDGAKKDERSSDAYRWGFDEKITVDGTTVRNLRYTALAAPSAATVLDDTPIVSDASAEQERPSADAPNDPSADAPNDSSADAPNDSSPEAADSPPDQEAGATPSNEATQPEVSA